MIFMFLVGPAIRVFTRRGDVPKWLMRPWGWFSSRALIENTDLFTFVRNYALRAANYKYVVGVCAVIRKLEDGEYKYLVVQHEYTTGPGKEKWGLPGGGVAQKDIRHALKEELRQELGIEISIERLLAVDESQPPQMDFFFECTTTDTLRPRNEVDAAKFVALSELPSNFSGRHLRVLHTIAPLMSAPEARVVDSPFPPVPVYFPPLGLSQVDSRGGTPYNEQQANGGASNGKHPKQESYDVVYTSVHKNQPIAPQVVHFSFYGSLDELPPPEPCSLCGGVTQTEYLDYQTEIDGITIFCDTRVPGYGCKDCGEKYWDVNIAGAVVEIATRTAASAGYTHEDKPLTGEVRVPSGRFNEAPGITD
jgi:ADP-ribose pyrophosphatase YjhB (NUDIX family)